MIEKLLANPYAGDGTLHPDMHLIYVDDSQEEGIPFILEGKSIGIHKRFNTIKLRCHT